MLRIYEAEADRQAADIRALFWEYLQWANAMVTREFGVTFEIEAMLEQDMRTLSKFTPPHGCLLLAEVDEQIAGIAGLRTIGAGTGEIKRMFVRPAFRGKEIGRAMLNELITQARAMGYRRICLDSARFMTAAHGLYRSAGFTEVSAYVGSEIPRAFQAHWIFMERKLE